MPVVHCSFHLCNLHYFLSPQVGLGNNAQKDAQYVFFFCSEQCTCTYSLLKVVFKQQTQQKRPLTVYSNHIPACTVLNMYLYWTFFQTPSSWSNSPSLVVERCRPECIISANACSLFCCESCRHSCCGDFTSERSWHFCKVIKGSKKWKIKAKLS